MSEQPSASPAFRPYLTHVSRVERLSEHFMRITLTGPELEHFGTDGYDQRIKIMLPLADGTWSDPLLFDPDSMQRGAWYEQWRAIAPNRRNIFRTYTIRAIDIDQRELTVDFVLHPHAGPAGRFAEHATPGDELVVIGPDSRSAQSDIGIDFHPGAARRLLLIGDETAAPAVGAILDSLQRDQWSRPVQIIMEVPTKEDIPSTRATWDFPVEASWLARGPARHGSTLLPRVAAVAADITDSLEGSGGTIREQPGIRPLRDINVDRELLWEVPAPIRPTSRIGSDDRTEDPRISPCYIWVAGEAASVRDIRRLLVHDYRIDRNAIAFMGYWRLGKSEI